MTPTPEAIQAAAKWAEENAGNHYAIGQRIALLEMLSAPKSMTSLEELAKETAQRVVQEYLLEGAHVARATHVLTALQQLNASRDAEVAKLKAHIASITKGSFDGMQAQAKDMADLRAENERLAQPSLALLECRNQRDQLRAEVERLKKELDGANRSISEYQKIGDTCASLISSEIALRAENERLSERVAKLTTELHGNRVELETKQRSNGDLRAENTRIQQSLAEAHNLRLRETGIASDTIKALAAERDQSQSQSAAMREALEWSLKVVSYYLDFHHKDGNQDYDADGCCQRLHDILKASTAGAELLSRLQKAEDALAGMFGMVEAGTLVRDASHDHDPKWFLTAMELAQVLAKAKSALSARSQTTAVERGRE
jgi:chromosome segregation ATPase